MAQARSHREGAGGRPYPPMSEGNRNVAARGLSRPPIPGCGGESSPEAFYLLFSRAALCVITRFCEAAQHRGGDGAALHTVVKAPVVPELMCGVDRDAPELHPVAGRLADMPGAENYIRVKPPTGGSQPQLQEVAGASIVRVTRSTGGPLGMQDDFVG